MRTFPTTNAAGQPLTLPPVTHPERSGYVTEVLEYELITPLFGGGVEPTQADPVTVIRATEVRGHLRFWWRATQGGRFGSLEEMKEIEDVIWGAASTQSQPRPSNVQVVVHCKSRLREYVKYQDFGDELKYAAFPLQKENKATHKDGIVFTVQISYPNSIRYQNQHGEEKTLENVVAEIDAALWAWGNFGGLGARTRRGFGAIRLIPKDDQSLRLLVKAKNKVEVADAIQDGLDSYVVDGEWPLDVPRLNVNLFYYRWTDVRNDPIVVWKTLIGELKKFRQQRKGFSRTKWPEPDAIRRITKQWLTAGVKRADHPGHAPRNNVPHKFPRAVFGLPIVFHFKDSDEDNPKNAERDPRETVVKLAEYDRLASPLILRPLWLSENCFVGIALVFGGALAPEDFHLQGINLILRENNNFNSPPLADGLEAELTPEEARGIKEAQTNGSLLGDETNPLFAFLDRIQKEEAN